eukprot:TRINITY_DN26132_c0_g1_i1.p1 TRINITY_DN26132_c0_g1~~TRINITY_DN26132_c0_g1_i1.p1  ORF type:complete len:698 (-),score=118.82 TRINITY_DN26132_c0_g1_i1:139-2232(-)
MDKSGKDLDRFCAELPIACLNHCGEGHESSAVEQMVKFPQSPVSFTAPSFLTPSDHGGNSADEDLKSALNTQRDYLDVKLDGIKRQNQELLQLYKALLQHVKQDTQQNQQQMVQQLKEQMRREMKSSINDIISRQKDLLREQLEELKPQMLNAGHSLPADPVGASTALSAIPNVVKDKFGLGDLEKEDRLAKRRNARKNLRKKGKTGGTKLGIMSAVAEVIGQDSTNSIYQKDRNFGGTTVDDDDEAGRHIEENCLSKFVRTPCFKLIIIILILSNTIFIAIQTQFDAQNLESDEQPFSLWVVDMIYCVAFLLEILLRMTTERREFLGVDVRWNLFDLCLVVLAIQDQVSAVLLQTNETGRGDFSYLRTMRVLRILRVFRLFKFCPQLGVIIHRILESIMAMVWLFVLLGVILFMVGIVLMTATTNYAKSDDADFTTKYLLIDWFSDLPTAAFCLFKIMSGGLAWEPMGDAVMRVGYVYGFIFIVYLLFVLFGIMNVMTAVFVESATENTRKLDDEKKAMWAEDMQRVLINLDKDDSGSLSFEEFEGSFDSTTELQEFIRHLNLRKSDALYFFDLLPIREDKKVDIRLVTREFMRLVGSVKNTDIIFCLFELRRLSKDFHNFCCFSETQFKVIQAALGILPVQAKRSSMSQEARSTSLEGAEADDKQPRSSSPSPRKTKFGSTSTRKTTFLPRLMGA